MKTIKEKIEVIQAFEDSKKMTDEEKARFEVKGWKEEDNCVRAFLKGLAEGRKEKWHKIKYCSQDLPPRSKDNHLHSVIVSNEYGEPIYYDYNIDEWCDMEGDVVSEGYKYWCELPKFEE